MTGSRTILLSAPAREVVKRRMAEGSGPWVFPSPRDPSRPRGHELSLWYKVRREAGIADVRLHDLRHTVASEAAMNGVPLPVVARLLGHANVCMTCATLMSATARSRPQQNGLGKQSKQ